MSGKKKKFEFSLKSGASANDVYRSELWYYEMMSFLSNQEAPGESTSNLDVQEESILEVGKINIHSHCLNCIIYFNINHINFYKNFIIHCIMNKKHI